MNFYTHLKRGGSTTIKDGSEILLFRQNEIEVSHIFRKVF